MAKNRLARKEAERMLIRFDECNAAGTELFQDLANHSRVDALVEACLTGKSAFSPSWLAVSYQGKAYAFLDCGEKTEDADKLLRKLRRVPAALRTIPNDTMAITADAFESELFIKLD